MTQKIIRSRLVAQDFRVKGESERCDFFDAALGGESMAVRAL